MSASDERLGTAAQEAARLVEALHGWWGQRVPGAPGGVDPEDPDPGVDRGAQSGAGHESSCRLCPWCRAVSMAQQVRPEVVVHLLSAAEAFAAALRELAREPAPERPPGPSPTDAQRPATPRTVPIPVADDDRDSRDDRDDQPMEGP